MSLHPQHASRSPYLHCLYACSAPPELQSSIPLYVLHVTATAARLQISMPLRFHIYTNAAHLQSSSTRPRPRAHSMPPSSRSPYLFVSTSVRLQRTPDLYISTSPGPQHASRAPDLHTSTSRRLHACSAPPEPQNSIPLCLLHVRTRTARLQSSRAPYLDVPTPEAHLQTSKAPYLARSHASQNLGSTLAASTAFWPSLRHQDGAAALLPRAIHYTNLCQPDACSPGTSVSISVYVHIAIPHT